MCGIAGYSLSPESSVKRTLAAQALLAGIAERGADAVGYAHRGPSAAVTVHKRRSGASELLERAARARRRRRRCSCTCATTRRAIPTIEANNHPIRHGSVVGIHNGIIVNDEEIFAHYGFERAHPDMTVDSEAIFALAEHADGSPEALEELHGAMATAWLDERNASTLFIARAAGRPLWIGTAGKELFFASTRAALDLRRADRPAELAQAGARRGDVAPDRGRARRPATTASRPTARTSRRRSSPSVRAPHEGASCLKRLAAIALATG